MDFRHQLTTVAGVASVDADAMLVVVVGNKPPNDLPAALGKALLAIVKQGDLALEAGRCLYVGHVPGVKAPRVAFAVAADGSPRAVKSALSSGVAVARAARAASAMVPGSRRRPTRIASASAARSGHEATEPR